MEFLIHNFISTEPLAVSIGFKEEDAKIITASLEAVFFLKLDLLEEKKELHLFIKKQQSTVFAF